MSKLKMKILSLLPIVLNLIQILNYKMNRNIWARIWCKLGFLINKFLNPSEVKFKLALILISLPINFDKTINLNLLLPLHQNKLLIIYKTLRLMSLALNKIYSLLKLITDVQFLVKTFMEVQDVHVVFLVISFMYLNMKDSHCQEKYFTCTEMIILEKIWLKPSEELVLFMHFSLKLLMPNSFI